MNALILSGTIASKSPIRRVGPNKTPMRKITLIPLPIARRRKIKAVDIFLSGKAANNVAQLGNGASIVAQASVRKSRRGQTHIIADTIMRLSPRFA